MPEIQAIVTTAAELRDHLLHKIATCGFVLIAAAVGIWPYSKANGSDLQHRPNIVLILADDLGYGDLGCYGQRRILTPHIDRLAAEGMRFTQFYAGSTVCAPSRCVLMTGLHTGHCYIRGNSDHSLRSTDRTVADFLKTAGYTNGIFGKWGLGQEGTDGVPTRKGFEEFFGYLDQHHAHNYYPAFLIANESRMLLRNVVPGAGPYGSGVATKKVQYSADLILERALAFIDRNRDRPFFLYFASTLPHANNEARPNGMEIGDYGPYSRENWPTPEKGQAAMISRLDADVGRLLDRLEQRGLERKTIVFFASDNGAHHEGGHDAKFFRDSGPLRGTKRDLYEGGIRVPLIARWPGRVPAGVTSGHVGYFGDFFATAAEIAKTTLPPGLDSLSFLPTLLGHSDQEARHPYLYWEFYERGEIQAVRLDNWKGIIRAPGSARRQAGGKIKSGKNTVELYDLGTDLSETADVAGSHPQIVERILAAAKSAHSPSPLWPQPGQEKAAAKTSEQ